MTGLALLAVSVMQVASPVRVDGVLDEAVWKDAAWCSDMKRLEMNDNLGPFSRKTEFAILADDRCVYVGVRCEGVSARTPLGFPCEPMVPEFIRISQ